MTDLTENTMRSYERNPDDENRLFYVGATRTKENLHIIEPKKYEKGYLLWQIKICLNQQTTIL